MGIFRKLKCSNIVMSNCSVNTGNTSIVSINGKTTVKMGGKTYEIPSGNVSIINNQIYADGKLYTEDGFDKVKVEPISITVEGNVESIDCDCNVNVIGDVNNVDCGGSVGISGDMKGDINCGGSVTIKGNHHGEIDCGGSVYMRG